MLTELEKYELINKCENVTELEDAIITIGGTNNTIVGREKQFKADYMASFVRCIVNDTCDPRYLTRAYGIRQQALYLKHYSKT